jgi:hypothetical protein
VYTMDTIIIVLGIIVILLAYYIYTVLNAVPSVANNIDLTKPPVIIKSSTISDPYSANYTIGAWIYIFNFPSADNQIGRFLMYGDNTPKGKNVYWSLRMDDNSPTLYCDILVNKSGSGGSQTQTVTITNNFPIQKWVYVVTTVSAGFIECYLNGSFVLAQTLTNTIFTGTPPSDPSAGATFTFGAQGTLMDDGKTIRKNGSPMVLNLVSRWNYPLSAGDVYNNYNKGNGQSTNIWGPAYHMNINLAQGTNNYVLPIF